MYVSWLGCWVGWGRGGGEMSHSSLKNSVFFGLPLSNSYACSYALMFSVFFFGSLLSSSSGV